MRWWLLQRVARWCGLKVGMTSRRRDSDDLPVLVILAADDKLTLEAISLLGRLCESREHRIDSRKYQDWIH